MSVPMLRQSERGSFQRCKQRWWWDWREGLVPRHSDLGPLWFGTGIHLALAKWYTGPGTKRGVEPAETWAEYARDSLAVVKTMIHVDDEARMARYEDAASLGAKMLEGYRTLYGRDDHWSVIAPELSGSTEIPWPKGQELYDVKPSDVMAILGWTSDLVARDLIDEWLLVVEHKSAKAISTRHLALDNQGGTYWALTTRSLRERKLIGPKETLRGIEYNFLRKALPDDRPRDAEGYYVNKPVKADYIRAVGEALVAAGREVVKPLEKWNLPQLQDEAERFQLVVLGERSKVQGSDLFERHMIHRTGVEQATQLKRLQAEAFEMQLYRDGSLPMTKNPTKDCGWDCSFYAMCELQERGGNWGDFRDLTYRAEDPYAAHRKAVGE